MPDAVRLCVMAKRFVTGARSELADQASRTQGRYGYLGEYGVGKIVRDLRMRRIPKGRERDHADDRGAADPG